MGEGGARLALASLGEPPGPARIGGGHVGAVGFYRDPQG